MSSGLHICLANDLAPPTAAHKLLLSFHFGNGPAPHDHPAIVSPHLHPIDRDMLFENWWVTDDVEFTTRDGMRVAECGDYAVVIFESDESDTDNHEQLTHDAYRRLLDVVNATQHPQLVKIWNYIGNINEGEGDDERYRQFSVGRALAFSESDVEDQAAPTGTGVGMMRQRGLSITALCSRCDFALAENPRQVSAFNYPRQYGPKSPKFGRGGSVVTRSQRLHLISGTAAIVGHESMHPGDTQAQLDETLRNLDTLCHAVSEIDQAGPKLVLDEQSVLRVYLRDPDDYPAIAKSIRERLGLGPDQVVFLRGDICRQELMLEIDGVRIQ